MPINTAEDLLHKLGGAKYFSKIDLSKGYWQIPVAEEDTHKTAFVTPDGQYEFLRMPFGMANAGATLVRVIKISSSTQSPGSSISSSWRNFLGGSVQLG